MAKINNFKEGIKRSNQVINDIMFLYKFRVKETSFTRMGRSKMKFNDIILFILNFVKRSLQIELDDFFDKIQKNDIRITKQAFSQARWKVSPKAFIHLLNEVNKWFYNDIPFNKYRGHRLLAIDGTVLQIHDSENLRNIFGYIENQNSEVARARASALYDIENDMIIASKLCHYRTGERETAEELINELCEIGTYNDLILFDRGYPSHDFIRFIESKNIKYLMRVSTGFFKVVVNALNVNQIIDVSYKGYTLKMRVVKFKLDSGIGETPIAIEQDFYATMYLANMVALAKKDANQVIEEEYKKKRLKYEYKVNTNVLIGKLKDTLITMISTNNPLVLV